jgi:hypothetical protein
VSWLLLLLFQDLLGCDEPGGARTIGNVIKRQPTLLRYQTPGLVAKVDTLQEVRDVSITCCDMFFG